MKHPFTNRLAEEKSPYLLQHAHNPVDWYPWGEEAFAKAAAEDKPIFLSIGYSTCHWCHVMEHESFEDTTVAKLMNDVFVNIKVDREERPDVDDIYMTVCQMLTGHGGWPLTIVMTPDKKPFFAATYIPKEDRFGRMGMKSMIPKIKLFWHNERAKATDSAAEIAIALQRSQNVAGDGQLGENLAQTAFEQFAARYDDVYGGFSEKPKFPTPHNLMFLLRMHQKNPELKAFEMVDRTLTMMRRGGIYDHVGFGFHRYSTDQRWLVPHFEKMLYDQAMLLMAYAEAFQVKNNGVYRQTAEQIITYITRDMTDSNGGFYSAEDADSEGEEGKFYVWSEAEVQDVLGNETASLYTAAHNFEAEGNFLEETTGHKIGTNIPHLQGTTEDIAVKMNLAETELLKKLEEARKILFDVREKRIHPLKDDKILTDWNGLMIAASCKAHRAFDSDLFLEPAKSAADFVLSTMRLKDGRLMHRYREGEIAITGFLDDYAFMIWGLLELYESTFDLNYLEAANELTKIVIEDFYDQENGGFFFTSNSAEKLLMRKKDIYDGAIPSGNSVMMLNLLRLSKITGNTGFDGLAENTANAFAKTISSYPSAQSMSMMALMFASDESSEIVIAGDPTEESTQNMLREVQKRFMPHAVILLKTDENAERLASLAPFTKDLLLKKNETTAFVCRNYACGLPTSDIQQMISMLRTN
ncbi:MAG: thioredoxin domain-containing protein [Calditrichia bacterium]